MLTAKQLEIVEYLKALAEKNYDKGWDFFVECYGKKEWADFMVNEYHNIATKAEALKEAKFLVKMYKEKESNQCSGEW